jgi:hypothetical protein
LLLQSVTDGDVRLLALGTGDIKLDCGGDITLDADGDNIKMVAGSDGSGLDFIQSGTGDYTIKNLTSDKDIIFNVNDGGSDSEVFRLQGSDGNIRMYQSNAIEFGGASEYISGNGNDLSLRADDNLVINIGGEIDFNNSTAGFTAQTATGDGTTSINWQQGNKYHLLFLASTNETITFGTDPSKPCNLLLKLKQPSSGAGSTVNWEVTSAGTIYWAGGGTEDSGSEPTLSTGVNDVDIISFYFDGTNYYGVASLGFDA